VTGEFVLDWAIMAVSLFNTILLLWLGLTVLLNAERRTWGMWLAGSGLLMGAAFFVSHSAILGHGLRSVGQGMDFWWHAGWVPAIVSPFAWYVEMLWYAGFWEDRQSGLHRRQRPWFLLSVLLAFTLAGLLIFANPFSSYSQLAQLNPSATQAVAGIPLLILVYPFYIVLCISLSLDVLRHPGPSGRVMGDLARRRARPWLVATSAMLLVVSLLVAWAMLWFVLTARQRTLYGAYTDMAFTVAWFDLITSSLIATAVILLGQAVVTYEIFTGKTLPRRGFLRQWRRAVILAAGYGAVVSWGLTLQLHPIYGLLLATVLVTVFYALLSWRSYAERERYIDHLRPFVTSQRLYEHLLPRSPSSPSEVSMTIPFRALCGDVLGTRLAYLIALGPLAPLAGPALTYPDGPSASLPCLASITARFDSPQSMCVPVDPAQCGGAMWAVPLWSERGLIGVLLLGEKSDGSLYTQEEIEIARVTGERLIDTQASAEMAQRLMALQRQRLAESQVLDRQARRMLHDDVLPRLHTAMLTLSSGQATLDGTCSEAITLLADVHRQIADLLREMPATSAPEVTRLGLVGALRQAVDSELGSAFDDVVWQVEPKAEREAQSIAPTTAEVLFYAAREAIRNAARYGRNPGATCPLHLRLAVTWHDGLEILIEDDGVGLGAIEASNGGSGQGLALHSTLMAVVGGSLATESVPGRYTRIRLTLPQETW
jgi:signal transduction histidine kinase